MSDDVMHWKSFWGGFLLFGVFLLLAFGLGMNLPDRYPTRFDASGVPTQWGEGAGNWILLVVIASFCFGQGALFQRFVLNNPDSTLINLPQKKRFQLLPRDEKIPILRRLNRMLGIINILTLLLFLSIFLTIYIMAVYPYSPIRIFSQIAIWGVVAGVLIYPLAEVVIVRRMILNASPIDPA